LLEAIRIGLELFSSKTMSAKANLADIEDPKQRDEMLQWLEDAYKQHDDPMVRE